MTSVMSGGSFRFDAGAVCLDFAHTGGECSGDTCPLVFVDSSRPGARRWCAMERCGNRHKLRALRARRNELPTKRP
ncbi:hypothetical protein FB565_008006 [Actinoplanes lutulentus]|nr:CGNR zinc finger domain-containing protein [Actinoplanes lutulentus]MBB2948223.1 hypothetical protein [Actinoplanes lutulentus]